MSAYVIHEHSIPSLSANSGVGLLGLAQEVALAHVARGQLLLLYVLYLAVCRTYCADDTGHLALGQGSR